MTNFLGLIIDKNMKWHTHVQKVANKIRNVNGILHKFKYVFPHRILILIYTSLIESHINYCILLWGTNYDKIFKLQKQAIRTISLNHFNVHNFWRPYIKYIWIFPFVYWNLLFLLSDFRGLYIYYDCASQGIHSY